MSIDVILDHTFSGAVHQTQMALGLGNPLFRTKLADPDRPVTLANAAAFDQWNVRRDAKIRSLCQLEEVGLLSIQRAVGRA